jgi:hypothetical protein
MLLLKLLLILLLLMKMQICMKTVHLELFQAKELIVVNQWEDLEFLSMEVLAYQELVEVWFQDKSIQERY